MTWKKDLIDLRRDRLSQDTFDLQSSPFPWQADPSEWEYRTVQLSGYLDHTREMRVGPRSFAFSVESAGEVGFLLVTPLILKDGSQILVNRGAMSLKELANRPVQIPEPVTVRGVLVRGELGGAPEWWRLKNRPHNQQFLYLDAKDLASVSGITHNFREASVFVVSALEEKRHEGGGSRGPKITRKKKDDFMLFYGDEHTHLWYAAQWFISAALLATMTCYRTYFLAFKWKF
jgi:cytochrome oxidase assembly protein ShyY1